MPLSQRFCRIRRIVHADSTLKGSPSFAALKTKSPCRLYFFQKNPKTQRDSLDLKETNFQHLLCYFKNQHAVKILILHTYTHTKDKIIHLPALLKKKKVPNQQIKVLFAWPIIICTLCNFILIILEQVLSFCCTGNKSCNTAHFLQQPLPQHLNEKQM